jgi:hypothetical protein
MAGFARPFFCQYLNCQFSQTLLQRLANIYCQHKKCCMKVICIAILAGSIIFATACTKQNSAGERNISGSWELRKATGGILALIKYAPGNGHTQQFESNHRFRVQRADSLLYEGTYTIEPANNKGDWRLWRSFRFNGALQSSVDSVRFTVDQLIFLPPFSCCDMQTIFYEKLK